MKLKNINHLNNKMQSFILLFTSLIFYVFFALYDGAVICADSPSYIDMQMSREPAYPIFLLVLRTIFSFDSTFYLDVAVFLQSILAAIAAWCLVNYLRKELKLSFIMSYLMLWMPLATSLLCRFAAKRSAMYSNSILTEGVACSLFLIFIRYLFEYCCHYTRKSLTISCLLSFLLISTRKQMYLTLILLSLGLIYVFVKRRKIKSGLATLFICVLGVMLSVKILDMGYVYALHGTSGTHSNDNRFLATMVFYVAEKEDFASIKDAKLRALSEEIYTTCDEGGYLRHSVNGGWYDRVSHFGDYYDRIQIDTMWPSIEQYVAENYDGNIVSLEKQVDSLTDEIIFSLLPHVWPKILACFADNCLSGLITTVAQRRPVLIIYSVLIYLLYMILLVRNIRKSGFDNLALFSVLTLVSVLVNVAIVSVVIFCQTRYTIYNMPLFYMCLILQLKSK